MKRWWRSKPVQIAAIAGTALTAFWLWRRYRDTPLVEPEHEDIEPASGNLIVRLVVPHGRLTGRYGTQRTSSHVHRGIDIAAEAGTPITSPEDAEVVGTWPDCERSGYGNTALLEHPSGLYTFYAHMQEIAVSAGDILRKGDVVGWVGSTRCGISRRYMAPHLHFEVHRNLVGPRRRPTINEHNPNRIDPLVYLEQQWRDENIVQA